MGCVKVNARLAWLNAGRVVPQPVITRACRCQGGGRSFPSGESEHGEGSAEGSCANRNESKTGAARRAE